MKVVRENVVPTNELRFSVTCFQIQTIGLGKFAPVGVKVDVPQTFFVRNGISARVYDLDEIGVLTVQSFGIVFFLVNGKSWI